MMTFQSRIVIVFMFVGLFVGVLCVDSTFANDEFPQRNAWFRATPSVVWCGDPQSTTTLEVHIVERTDVARVWLTGLGTNENDGRAELFDDGTHGDQQAGDNIFTLNDVIIPCDIKRLRKHGYNYWDLFLRVELTNGQQIGNNFPFRVGLVDSKYKGGFEVTESAPGITATAYALFIEDAQNEVFDDYPIATIYCGKTNFSAYQKLYSVLPDVFDIAMVQPGMQLFTPENLAENTPYNVLVSNQVQNIGVDIFDDTHKFGSSGRLKSTIYLSFSSIDVFDHEIVHTWGPAIGQSLGLLNSIYNYDVNQGHWNEFADMEGQVGSYYFDPSGKVGHFSYKGNETWSLISNLTVEPYSPLDLYIMGLIPPEEVPPIHILNSPDTTDIENITASSFQTVTIEDIIAAEGGERIPSSADSQKDFSLAFIVTQDIPYNDAAYAYFSLMSYHLTTHDSPTKTRRLFGPFYWATGGLATLETLLPLNLAIPNNLPGQSVGTEDTSPPASSTEEVVESKESSADTEISDVKPSGESESESSEISPNGDDTPGCSLLPIALIALPGLLARRKYKNID
jgi:hypothetical protein